MATINENGLLLNNDRVFLPSNAINVFPCSRRGQSGIEDLDIENSATYYDPEARLNTERTNRIHTAVNGFKDSFISSYADGTLVFVLAGYHIEVKNFDPAAIASVLGADTETLYAHLSLHTNVSLGVTDYFTEMLNRQSDLELDKNYLDVSYVDGDRSGDFFVGVSFVKEAIDDPDAIIINHNLQLFSYINDEWVLVQTSLLPKIEHGEVENSIRIGSINSDLAVKHVVDDVIQDTFTVSSNASTINVPLAVTKSVDIDGPTSIRNNLDVQNTLKAPVLDVKVIKNTEAGASGNNPGVFIEDDLSIAAKHAFAADTININNISSRVSDGAITANSPINLTKALTVSGDTTITGATRVDNTITAEKLVITDIDDNGVEKGEIKTPQLRVNRITSDGSDITVDNKKLIVNRSLEMRAKADAAAPAKATIEQAVIGDLTVKADPELKSSTGTITATTVNSDRLSQKIGDTYRDVPVIFVQQLNSLDSNEYQLQISRANILPYEPN
jgi:hypothetical protein